MRKLNSDDFQRVFDGTGPLSSFSAKILIGYSLRLYGEVFRHDMDIIRELRNGFAHTRMPLAFEQPEVAAMCAQLRMASHPELSWLPVPYSTRFDLDIVGDNNHPRTRFTRACHTISVCLLDQGHAKIGLGGVERQLP